MSTPPLITLNQAAASVAAYQAAVRLGVLDRIDRTPATAEQVATDCGISRRGCHALLEALASVGLVARDGDGRFRPAAAGLAALHPMVQTWQHLATSVRDGVPADRTDTADGAGLYYPTCVAHLTGLVPGGTEWAARLLPPSRRLLDVGAGAAAWSLELAARDPACRVTALDLPAVLTATRSAVQQAGRGRQFTYVAGDVFNVELPAGHFDLILAANLCHLFDASANRVLLGRLAPLLCPGGTLAVIDAPPTPALALHQLSLLLRTAGGRLYPAADYQSWLSDAGLTVAAPAIRDGDPPLVLVTATARPPTGASHDPSH